MARYGEVYDGRARARTGADAAGLCRRHRRRRSWVAVKSVSGGFGHVRRCSTRREEVQGVSEVVARRVSSARPWASLGVPARRHRHGLGDLGARSLAAVGVLRDHGVHRQG
jgi:hypothetical protein